jgi:hypothetical protein
MGDRRGRPVAGWLIVVVTLTGVFGGVLVASAFSPAFGPAIGPLFGMAVLLAGGLYWAWRVGTGHRRHERGHGESPKPGRTWRVSEPGTSLLDSPGGGAVVARLPAGSKVVEGERQADTIRVTDCDGNRGWVKRRSVF